MAYSYCYCYGQVVMSNLIPRLPSVIPSATKTLILAHRTELLEQAMNQIKRFNPTLTVAIEQGKRKVDVENTDIIIASVQTLGRQSTDRLSQYDPAKFKAIIIDEAHHASASTYVRIMDHLGASQESSHICIWGCSATIRRHDGISLSQVFDKVTYHLDLLHMIKKGWLSSMKVTTVETYIDLTKVATQYDDFNIGDLSKAVNISARNLTIVQSWKKYAQENRVATLLFAVDITHTVSICNLFREHGIEAEYITSKSSPIERHDILQRFRDGKFSVLVNCGILTEGTDIPRIDCVLMARPTRSSGLFQQMFGRGMRLAPGKKDCLVIDFVDNFERVGKDGLVSLPTLLGLDSKELILDEDILNLETQGLARYKTNEKKKEDITIPDGLDSTVDIKVTEYDSLNELMEDHSGSPELRSASRFAWVAVGDSLCALSILSEGTFFLRKNKEGLWLGSFQHSVFDVDGSKVHTKPEIIDLSASTLVDAIHAADTWITKKVTKGRSQQALYNLIRGAKFRNDPATSIQLKYLEKYKIVPKNPLNKGQAMDLITRLKLGQKAIWKKMFDQKKIQMSKELQRRKMAVLSPSLRDF
ncbi:P-loop containing nucleoside triphosphate hydrolase protein [Spinellus fusiger]|nr:P-loop containing nucleoside triphosphate hydrolase protein [Spinellus fusiger]